jgi:hypothetical protein
MEVATASVAEGLVDCRINDLQFEVDNPMQAIRSMQQTAVQRSELQWALSHSGFFDGGQVTLAAQRLPSA